MMKSYILEVLRQIVSPGGQTIAINRDFDEIFGGYAHLFCFDFELMKILLKKWGFNNIKKYKPITQNKRT